MMSKAQCEYNNGTYQALDKTAVCSSAYRVPHPGGRGIENSEKCYASLQQKTEHLRRDGHDALTPGRHFQTEARQQSSDAATDDEIYENLEFQDESGA